MSSLSTTSLVLLLGTGLLAGCSVKPDLIGTDEMSAFVSSNAEQLVADQEAVAGAIGLYEAMARALKYNLDHKVEMMNATLAARAADVKSAAMLPQVVANSGYNGRDPSAGGYSRSLTTGIRSPDASTSTEKETLNADITASWNVLDFGLSYVRAKQATNEALIAEERKRRIVNRIIEDVRTAYWRAASAEHLLGGLKSLEGRVDAALGNSRSLANDGSLSPLTALTYQRELVDIRKQIHELELDLKTARIQLAALMNIPPGTDFKLQVSRQSHSGLKLAASGVELVELAMSNRPELREALLKERIGVQEANAALLQMLPGIQAFGGVNWDSNDLLFHSNWLAWGAKASWNVMRVFSYPAIKKENEARADLNRTQALAMTMAVFTQVHAARARYVQQALILRDASDYLAVQRKILKQVKSSAAEDATSDQALIREEMNTLVASVKFDIAHADLQNAFANVYATVGLDPYGAGVTGAESVQALSSHLRSVWIERGDKSGS
ncbi:MAG: TolC family protein [Phyllobacteriaceae bacterium]|nr:TolC family protein [Phyllobacteriaceae bacterium]